MDAPLIEDLEPAVAAAAAVEIVLLLAGLAVLWRVHLSASGRTSARLPRPLGTWELPGPDFLAAALLVIGGGLVLQIVLTTLVDILGLAGLKDDPDLWLILQGGAFQLGMLAGVGAAIVYTRERGRVLPPSRSTSKGVIVAGIATFLAALPVITVCNLAWINLLNVLGVPIESQKLVDVFTNTESSATIVLVVGFAVLVAPVTEELIFRAGLFRFLRSRATRWLVLVFPALLFASLHGDLGALVPLTMLGIVFAIAYERTGRIAVPIIAHALFNLNTILLLLAGVPVSV